MGFWLLFFVSLGFQILGELLRPKQKFEAPKPSSLGDFRFPTAQEGRVFPIFCGKCKFEGPNVTWFGDLTVKPIKVKQKTGLFSSTKVIVGYRYYLGLQAVFAVGYVDGDLHELRFDKKVVTRENIVTTADVISFNMNSPELFGKKDQEGGVTGPVKFYRGSFTQLQNEYLRGALGETEIPAYRPLAHMVFEHCYLGNSSTLPAPTVILSRYPNSLGVTGNKHKIGEDANPACWIYEIMTDRVWGACISSVLIDTAAFINVAETLYAEGLGVSMIVDSEQDADALIREILRHIDGVVYPDIETGLYTIALARDDYDVDDLLVLDKSCIDPDSIEFTRNSWQDTQNTVKIKFVDRDQDYTERFVQQQNLANISVRGGQIDAGEFDFTGLSNATTANLAAARVLATVSSPFANVSFKANRKAYKLRPGKVFKWVWPELNIEQMILRITDIDYGTLEDPEIKITAVEDIFGVTEVAYTNPPASGWTPAYKDPVNLTTVKLVEAPYEALGEEARVVLVYAKSQMGQERGYLVYTDPAGGTSFTQTADNTGFTPTGVLTADYDYTVADDPVGFTINATTDMEDVESVTAQERLQGKLLVQINDEIMAVQTVTNNNDGTFTISKVLRAVYDTSPANHPAGSRVWVLSDGVGTTDTAPYPSDITLKAKLLPYTATDTLPLASASTQTLVTSSRAFKPYPPAAFKVNGQALPAYINDDAVMTWLHRNKVAQYQSGRVWSQTEPGPAAGPDGTYTVQVYVNGVLKQTYSGLTGTTQTYTALTRIADDSNGYHVTRLRITPISAAGVSGPSQDIDTLMLGLGMTLGDYLGGTI